MHSENNKKRIVTSETDLYLMMCALGYVTALYDVNHPAESLPESQLLEPLKAQGKKYYDQMYAARDPLVDTFFDDPRLEDIAVNMFVDVTLGLKKDI